MKYLLIIFLFISCTKEVVEPEQKSTERRVTGPQVDLRIPTLDSVGQWRYKDSVGLMAKDPVLKKLIINSYWSKMFNRPIGDSVIVAEYDCVIGNYGYKDLVIDRSESGLYDAINN